MQRNKYLVCCSLLSLFGGCDSPSDATIDDVGDTDDFLDDRVDRDTSSLQRDASGPRALECIGGLRVVELRADEKTILLESEDGVVTAHQYDDEPETRRPNIRSLNEKLAADDRLVQMTGIERVKDCNDADAVIRARLELMESEPEPQVPDPNRYPEETFDTQPILNGFESPFVGAVEVSIKRPSGVLDTCTGALINPVAVLTAGHCFKNLTSFNQTNDLYLSTTIAISYHKPSTDAWTCLTNDGTIAAPKEAAAGSKCNAGSSLERRAVHVYIHKDYHGDDDPGHDLAVIMLKTGTWKNVATDDYLRVWTDDLADIDLFATIGRGSNKNDGTQVDPYAGAGVMRWGQFDLDWYSTYYYLSDADFYRTCWGDSGAPDVIGNFPPILLGLHVQSEKTGLDRCAKDGGKQRSVRLREKADWITARIAQRRSDYATHTDYSNLLGTYRRYW